jgi:NAD(P)H dehydrogenase (quinone)
MNNKTGGAQLPKILIAYYSKTGNTKQIAQAIAEGAKTVPDTTVELKAVQDLTAQEAIQADAFAFGSPTYFSIMSGPLLSLLTELYFVRDKLAGKPMVAFATGGGSQTKAVENIENVLKAFAPKLIQPGLAVGAEISETDKQQAKLLGEKLAKA